LAIIQLALLFARFSMVFLWTGQIVGCLVSGWIEFVMDILVLVLIESNVAVLLMQIVRVGEALVLLLNWVTYDL